MSICKILHIFISVPTLGDAWYATIEFLFNLFIQYGAMWQWPEPQTESSGTFNFGAKLRETLSVSVPEAVACNNSLLHMHKLK